MTTQRRTLLLEAAREAQVTQQKIGLKAETPPLAPIDVFAAIDRLGIPFCFRPLEKVLGLALTKPSRGILVSSQRSLHIQRFTAAHELGHLLLGHEGSIDSEISERGAFNAQRPAPEAAADVFAAEFLLPRWLLLRHLEHHRWGPKEVVDPHVVYQLSLRVGASYDATCWALHAHAFIDRNAAEKLCEIAPKKLKAAVLGDLVLANSWADAWRLLPSDTGAVIEGGPDDVLSLELSEQSAAGYLWDESALGGYDLLKDERVSSPGIGAAVVRRIAFRSRDPHFGAIEVKERRPWNGEVGGSFSVRVDLRGREDGMPRIWRKPLAA